MGECARQRAGAAVADGIGRLLQRATEAHKVLGDADAVTRQVVGRCLPDGRLELTLPYSSSRELLMDIQRASAPTPK